jgi:hypothetical protein
MNKKEINLETSQIPWHELQRFFASGLAISVDSSIDLVDVAYQFSLDNKAQVQQWLADKKVVPVSDEQALQWFENDISVWAVVIKPWILVQDKNNEPS